jgi:hypothetical protein
VGIRTGDKRLNAAILDNSSAVTTQWTVTCQWIHPQYLSITMWITPFQPAPAKSTILPCWTVSNAGDYTRNINSTWLFLWWENWARLQHISLERSLSRNRRWCLPEAQNCPISMSCLSRHVLHTFPCCQMDVRLLRAGHVSSVSGRTFLIPYRVLFPFVTWRR